MKKLLFFWNELKATFWFLPVLIILFSVVLSMGLVYLDSQIAFANNGWLRYFLVSSSDSARSILSTISGAMIGVAGTVFSVTLVALTLASSQFGPRLIKNFMYVRLNQIVLGSYIATYLYSLFVLNTIRDNAGHFFIPSISILVAIFAAIINIILLIIFIHRIAISIQADKVIADISSFIAKQVVFLFPEKMGKEVEEDIFEEENIKLSFNSKRTIKAPKSGYLQYISSESLLRIAIQNETMCELYCRPGSYMVENAEIGVLYFNDEISDEVLDKISAHFIVGQTKTSQQDLEFSIHQMVEIALRALSPGVNDPYTAIACIDNLTATMSYLAEVKFPSKYRFDEDENLRVITHNLDFEGVLNAAFNQIRQFSGGSTAVIIKLMEALITIKSFARKLSYQRAVIKHAEMVLRVGKETITEKNDLADLIERSKKILPNQA